MLRHIRLSVRPSHFGIVSKRGNAEGCGLYRRVAQCLKYPDAKNDWWGRRCPDKMWVQRGRPPAKTAEHAHISPRNGNVIDNVNSLKLECGLSAVEINEELLLLVLLLLLLLLLDP